MKEVTLKQAKAVLKKLGYIVVGHRVNDRYITGVLLTEASQKKIKKFNRKARGMSRNDYVNMVLESYG